MGLLWEIACAIRNTVLIVVLPQQTLRGDCQNIISLLERPAGKYGNKKTPTAAAAFAAELERFT